MSAGRGGPPIAIAAPLIGDEEWQALREPLESGWLTQGPKVREFEEAFARRHELRHAVATTSCTTALHVALAALGVGPGDEVVVPAFTWVATANVALHCGATPVFVDVEPDSFNMDPSALEAVIGPRTRAVIPVHLFGLCADFGAIRAAVPEHVPIVEDAACAVGASYQGRFAGHLGQAGCFSFHPRKQVTTGEGGMLTTDDEAFAARCRSLRNHGASVADDSRHASARPFDAPDFNLLGYNYRMTDFQAAVGVVQLGRLDAVLAERERRAAQYAEALSGLQWLTTPAVPDGYRHSWQSYVTVVASDAPVGRDDVLMHLKEHGISARRGTQAVPSLTYYRERHGTDPADYPTAVSLEAHTLALPLHNVMCDDDYARVIECLHAL